MKSLDSVIFKNSIRRDERIGKTSNEKVFSALSFLVVFFFFTIIMIGVSKYVTYKLDEFEQTYAFVNILLLVNFFILFTKSIFESLNILYFSKDLKILLRMPLKPISILHSKLINMIISEYLTEILMLAIPMIVYGRFVHVGILFYVYMIGILLVLPVIPIMMTSLIIAIIMRFTNMIKNKSKSMYITIILTTLIVGIVIGLLNYNSSVSGEEFESAVLVANGLSESVSDFLVLIKQSQNVLLNYNRLEGFWNFLIYLAESIAVYVVIIWIMSKIYLDGAKGATINSSRGNRRNNKLELKDFKKKSISKAYWKKEWKTMLRTPIFFLQCIAMPIAYPILVFVIMYAFVNFARSIGIDALSEFYHRIMTTWGIAVFVSIGQVFYMMNFSSIIAISREAQSSILVKYLPIDFGKQIQWKLCIGILTNLVSGIIVTITYYLIIQNLAYTILIFFILLNINLIGEKAKILIDLRNPQTTWDSEYTMMKQNTNVMYELFYTFIMMVILIITSFFFRNSIVFLLFLMTIVIIVNVAISEYIHDHKEKLMRKII